MDKKFVPVLILTIVLLGAGALVFSRKQPRLKSVDTFAPADPTIERVSTKLEGLLARKNSNECTFEYVDSEGSVISGTLYVAGGDVRGDFETNLTAGAVKRTSLIRSGTTSYLWDGVKKQGFKITQPTPTPIDKTATSPAQPSAYSLPREFLQGSAFDPTKEQVDYQCKPWTVEPNKFEMPSDVTFVDLSDLIEQQEKIKQSSGPAEMVGKAVQCSICNAASAADKATCLRALGCPTQ